MQWYESTLSKRIINANICLPKNEVQYNVAYILHLLPSITLIFMLKAICQLVLIKNKIIYGPLYWLGYLFFTKSLVGIT